MSVRRLFRRTVSVGSVLAVGGLLMATTACTPSAVTDTGQTTTNEPLGFDGSVSGKIYETQTTRASIDETSSSQTAPLSFDTTNAVIRFHDVAGNPLRDEQGQVLPDRTLNADGTFDVEGLPVGVDIIVCCDIGDDGTCDIESCIQIPSSDGGGTGELTDVRVDPLTTLILAKLRELIAARDIDVSELPISPVAVVTRIVNAYTHLFEEAGIDDNVSIDELAEVARNALAALFDNIIPEGARTGMDIVEGNLDAARATDDEARALSVAKVFVRAGFPIHDVQGGIDLSALGELDNVEAIPADEYFKPDDVFTPIENDLINDVISQLPDGVPEDLVNQLPDDLVDDFLDQLPDDLDPELLDELLAQLPAGAADAEDEKGFFDEGVVYVSTGSEPDRNFDNAEDIASDKGDPSMRPIINDFLLVQMAQLQQQGRRISLADLHEVLTSFDDGLGARLTYFVQDPNFFGPPLNIFETADGKGTAINLDRLFQRLFDSGLHELPPEEFDRQQRDLRALLVDLFNGTVPPGFERLFDGFVRDRITSIDDLTRAIREARAHLPFNNSGPSTFYVVADGDPFNGDTDVSAITVDADITPNGEIQHVTYNAAGEGKFYLGFTERTDGDGIVQLHVRETGRIVHSRRGPARASMQDESIFESIDGLPFINFVSESGTFFPGVSVTVVRSDFVPEAPPPAEGREAPGPNNQMFVLATGIGPDAEPVRVDYDRTTGTATYNPGGRNMLAFLPDSHETGVFALFNPETGRFAEERDPANFFDGPRDRPDGFEEFFNDSDQFEGDFQDFDNVDEIGDFIEGMFGNPGDMPPPPTDGGTPPPPGDMPPPPDGDTMPNDGGNMQPPADDGGADPAAADDEDQAMEDQPVDGNVDDQDPINDQPPPPPPPGEGEVRQPVFIMVAAEDVVGLDLGRSSFTHVFGTDVPNERYDSDRDPFFDDVNGSGEQDADEPTAPFRPTLFDPHDWRSTDIRLYYRASDGLAVDFEDVDFESETPRTLDGRDLVPRTYLPRRNAFRFGRPNTAVNLITAFAPPNFFNGTQSLNRDTKVDIFSAIAIVNLVMDQVFNVTADVDIDGVGPQPRRRMLFDAHLFVVPIGDPFQLLLDGFRTRSTATNQPQ